jgi:hypothetical protein
MFDVEIPWYLVAANGFDLQHFRAAHERKLLDDPVIQQPSPFARRIRATFEVTGQGWRDRLTRQISGPTVTMTVTSWCGTIILVTAEFRRTTSYGLVAVTPMGQNRTRMLTIVWVKRSDGALGRLAFDPINASVRRSFIRAFMLADRERSEGTRYTPETLIAADAVLADYFRWLGGVIGGNTNGFPPPQTHSRGTSHATLVSTAGSGNGDSGDINSGGQGNGADDAAGNRG